MLAHVTSGKNFKVTWCCDEGRLNIIFSLLCGFEPTLSSASPTKGKPKLQSKSEPTLGAAASQLPAPSNGGQPWQSLLSRGTGYGPAIYPPLPKAAAPSRNDNTSDLEAYFQALSFVLPCMTRAIAKPFDCIPPTVVAAMVRRSPMLGHASELLRSAAIEEISARHAPITAVLDFLETIAGHHNTGIYILRERTLFPRAEQLLQAVLGGARNRSAAEAASHETAQSLFTIVDQLAVPCRKFLQASERVNNAKDDQRPLAVMKRICALAEQLRSLGGRTEIKRTAQTQADAIARASSAWHRAHCLKEVPDDVIMEGFYYAKDAVATEKAKPAPGRMRKLLAQVASLSTDLPEGIFVRHGEGRPDLLKILIVGPAGTPYEHGLFEFDMFCGKNFPKSPPKMHFRTTGGGIAIFNPNLYVSGKSTYHHTLLELNGHRGRTKVANIRLSLPFVAGNMGRAALGTGALDNPTNSGFHTV